MSKVKMRYALVDGEKRLPEEKLSGTCPLCGARVSAKCGNIRIHHWAHINQEDCDSWCEGKTDWHIAWQNIFPKEWQEVTVEKEDIRHRADVLIPAMGNKLPLAIEFQHSFIEETEIKAREDFYGNMFWVIDLTGKKREAKRFVETFQMYFPGNVMGRSVWMKNTCFLPQAWLSSQRPVFLDIPAEYVAFSDIFFCILPLIPGDSRRWILCYPKAGFLEACKNGEAANILVNDIRESCKKSYELVKNELLQERVVSKRRGRPYL